MRFERSAGILLHPTSLPAAYGIGDFGPAAYAWVDWLAASGCRLWQILPLGPTGFGDSPYQCFSAMADMPAWNPRQVDYGALYQWKPQLLERAYQRFVADPPPDMAAALEEFRGANADWLDDYALFMAAKEVHGGGSWDQWPVPLRSREPGALEQIRRDLADRVSLAAFVQFLFFSQWEALKDYANGRGIWIIGDVPLFVAYDSADVWARPELFFLDDTGRPTVVAGVPPDYFSPTGQLWGNPLYRWEAHRDSGYAWWLNRLRRALRTADIVRLDHFRGLAGYWEIPGDATTAEHGRWVTGPGADFLQVVASTLEAGGADLPIIAEDLGVITPDVVTLRERFRLPGMKVLQFAFSGPDNPFLPHHFSKECVAYTGTHDNDTSRGWFASASQAEKEFALRYLDSDGNDFSGDLIRAAWASTASFALAPMQDFLDLGTEARMNYPSRLGGNWEWRMGAEAQSDALRERIQALNWLFQR
jgi:4-alpha-glucanotransferase